MIRIKEARVEMKVRDVVDGAVNRAVSVSNLLLRSERSFGAKMPIHLAFNEGERYEVHRYPVGVLDAWMDEFVTEED